MLLKTYYRPAGRIARLLRGLMAAACLTASASPAWSWQTAHGKPDNSGFAEVSTVPATTPLPNPPRLGGIAAGAGPVIAPDGTVYVANGRGKLMSFRPDGTPGWSRDIGMQGVFSSPALGNDGSIYLIGAVTIRDKTTNPPTTRKIAELHKFTASGGYLWHVPLPTAAAGLTTSAPPNIWRVGSADVIMVPAVRRSGSVEARLTAFSSDTGAVLADQVVKSFSPQATGGAGLEWWQYLSPCAYIDLGCDFEPPTANGAAAPHALPNQQVPFPAVAIYNPTRNSVPLVMMSDGFQDLVGYFFNGSSFMERFRVRDDKRYVYSTPLAWPDGHVMITSTGSGPASDVMFAGIGMSTIRAAGPISMAAPTALGNSRFAIVHRFGGTTIMRGASIETAIELPGDSIASAAASRGHLFVSTASALHTFDKVTMEEVARFDWTRGGASPVAIGPQGHVYAIADDRLFVFPPRPSPPATDADAPKDMATGPMNGGFGGGVFQDGGIPASTKHSQSYDPPLTANGNRVFACEELDGDDCGKGDHRAISLAFCQRQDFAKAADFDVGSRKGKAETLDGRFCSKNKCKVFDEIVCQN